MRGYRRLQGSTVMLAALLLFGTLHFLSGNAAAGNGAGWGQSPGRPEAVVAAGNTPAAVTAPAALDTRLLSEARSEQGQRASGHDGLSAASLGPSSGPSGRRAAAAVERAAHPERRSGTRLRGPPGLPV